MKTKFYQILSQMDKTIDKYITPRVRAVMFFSLLFSFPLISFVQPEIYVSEITIGLDTSFFYDQRFSSVDVENIDLSLVSVESTNFSTIRSINFFNPKPKPKPKIKYTKSGEKEVLPLVNSITNEKLEVTLKDINESILSKSYVTPPNGYFTKNQWNKLSNEERQKYIDAFIIKNWKAVHEEYLATGVHPLIILVKGIDETRYGTSKLFYDSKNWGAIKYTNISRSINHTLFRKNSYVYADDDCGTKACIFFKFNSIWEGRRAFSLFVKKDRYTKHLKNSKNISKNTPADWCNALYKGKYSSANNKGKFTKMSKEVLQRAKDLGLPIYLNNYGV